MSAMEHDEAQASLGAYVLGAMPADEIAQIRAHVLSCEECMREADALTEASSSFALSAGVVPLPAGFSEQVLGIVREERNVGGERAPSRRRRRLAIFAGAAAALITIASLGALVVTRSDLAQRERLLAAVLQEDGVELRGTSGASAKVVVVDGGSTFAVAGLDQADQGRAYVLWFIEEGEPRNIGTFDVRDGIGILESELSVSDFDAAAVTIETDPEVQEPQGDIVLSSS